MNQNEALQNLINGVEKGQSNGVYSLEEAAVLWESVKSFLLPVDDNSINAKTPSTVNKPKKRTKNENN